MRAAADDLMQGFRFHVTAIRKENGDPLAFNRGTGFEEGGGQAGFQNCTIPEVSLEPVEYREGISKWTQKYVGPPTVADCTLARGVSKRDTAFFDWIMAALNGDEYRADITIWHFHRTEMGKASDPKNIDDSTMRGYVCSNCVPTRVKPAMDFDSMAGEVSLTEIDFAIEGVDINKGA